MDQKVRDWLGMFLWFFVIGFLIYGISVGWYKEPDQQGDKGTPRVIMTDSEVSYLFRKTEKVVPRGACAFVAGKYATAYLDASMLYPVEHWNCGIFPVIGYDVQSGAVAVASRRDDGPGYTTRWFWFRDLSSRWDHTHWGLTTGGYDVPPEAWWLCPAVQPLPPEALDGCCSDETDDWNDSDPLERLLEPTAEQPTLPGRRPAAPLPVSPPPGSVPV